jgi:hypothetical protein
MTKIKCTKHDKLIAHTEVYFYFLAVKLVIPNQQAEMEGNSALLKGCPLSDLRAQKLHYMKQRNEVESKTSSSA